MVPILPPSQLRLRSGRVTIDPRPGDLLFGNRLSSVQMVMNLSADQWTHVALVVDTDGSDSNRGSGDGLRTAELGPRGCLSRTVSDFRAAYRYVGLARPMMGPGCRHRVVSNARLQLEVGDVTYSWRYCMLVGGAALARRFAPAAAEPQVIEAGRRVALELEQRVALTDATCSSFIAALLNEACGTCRLGVQWPSRQRVPPWRPRPSVTDVAPASPLTSDATEPPTPHLIAPSDLWVADGYELRAVIESDSTTLLCELDRAELEAGEREHTIRRGGELMNPNPNPNPAV
ncbi:MAG: hypothetical protein GY724_05270 [Actinomycetia bacterium]|nr:hypothetical protein [Actinomycetes bacterium]